MDSIFALCGEDFLNTPKDRWEKLERMIGVVGDFSPDKITEDNKHMNDEERRKDSMTTLIEGYPFLKFTEKPPGKRNPYWVLQARISVWSDAYLDFGYSRSSRENQLTDAFVEFGKAYDSGEYNFLQRLSPITLDEAIALHDQTLRDFLAFTEKLKSLHLTPRQKDDRKQLESWILHKIQENKEVALRESRSTN